MFSKKQVFESYLGRLGLNKTALEAVKDINGVLFEGIDDFLDDFGGGEELPADDFEVGAVEEKFGDEPKAAAPVETKKEYTPSDLMTKAKIPFDSAWSMALKWVKTEPRFSDFGLNFNNGFDNVEFMIPTPNGKPTYFRSGTVPYEITAEGEEGVPKYGHATATNPVVMSNEVYNRIITYYEENGYPGIGDLKDIPFIDIKRLVLGTALHRTGEEAPNIGLQCKVEVNPSATVLSTSIDDRDITSGLTKTNEAKKNELSQLYGLPVESLYKVVLKEWTDASDQYYMDENTGFIYDVTRDASMSGISDKDLREARPHFGSKKTATISTSKLAEWAQTQDMFKLLLEPGSRKVVSSTIYQVPKLGPIEGIESDPKYVYMDDANYDKYIKSVNDPSIESQVKRYDVGNLNNIISKEYKQFTEFGQSDRTGSNVYGHDENGWVENIECQYDGDKDKYVLTADTIKKLKAAYGARADVKFYNYIAGKNTITIGGQRNAQDGTVSGGFEFHPLIMLRDSKGRVIPRMVAVFDDSCCKPGESITRIVGKNGLTGSKPTIYGFATITNSCNLEKVGEFNIFECLLSQVDISKSTGYVSIGSLKSDMAGVATPTKTEVTNTYIAVGNNGATQVLPNNRAIGETVDGVRGVTIEDSVVSDSRIENGYANIVNSVIRKLNVTNAGVKVFNGWRTDDASNVQFAGDKKITVTGHANYRGEYKKSPIKGKYGYRTWIQGDVTTNLAGDVVLDSSSGNIVCSGSVLNNVVVNGPCKIRTCKLSGTTVGYGANAGDEYKSTDLTAVTTNPGGNSPGYIRIEHGTNNPTVLGDSDSDKESGSIVLTGRVYIEGGAQIQGSEITSEGDDLVYVRSNMRLNTCLPYSLNEEQSGLLSRYIKPTTILTGDCTDLNTTARRLNRTHNSFGTSANRQTPFERYEQFKAGDTSDDLKELSVYDSKSLVNDFLKSTSSVLMDPSVFMELMENGDVVPKPELKRTVWDPIGGFVVGAIKETRDGAGNAVTKYGRIVLLKCPNVILNHDAIARKKKTNPGQDVDFKTYLSGAITLRQYLKFLDDNGYRDCYQYNTENGFGEDFVQLCYIKDGTMTPYKMTLDQMNTIRNNIKRQVSLFLDMDTNQHDIRDVDTYSSIVTAYTDKDGGMTVQTERNRYTYTTPVVDSVGKAIVSTRTKRWFGDDGKGEYERKVVDCSKDGMYKMGYTFLVKHSTGDPDVLSIIHRAVSGKKEGLKAKDAIATKINELNGMTMQSNDLDLSVESGLNRIVRKIKEDTNSVDSPEKVYILTLPARENSNQFAFVLGNIVNKRRMSQKVREGLDNIGCEELRCRKLKYIPETDKFVADKNSGPVKVKLLDNIKSANGMDNEHFLARLATEEDFRLLGYPVSNVRK